MTESTERLARLRRKLAATDDPEDRADLDPDQQQRFIGNWSRSLHRLLYGLGGAELEQAVDPSGFAMR